MIKVFSPISWIMITQAAGRLYYYNLYRYRSWICGWRAICLKHIEARRRDLQARKCLGWIKLESITFKVGIYQNQPNGPSGGFRTTPARWRSSGAPKTLAFLRAAEFGWARMAERATGRSSRGRNPRSDRKGATQRLRACCAMAAARRLKKQFSFDFI